MYDEVLGKRPKVKFFSGLLVLAALWTIPRILLTQLLSLGEQSQAVIQLKHRAFLGGTKTHAVVLLHVLPITTNILLYPAFPRSFIAINRSKAFYMFFLLLLAVYLK